MLKYCLYENLLTVKPDDYIAQATDSSVFTLEDIINHMVKCGTNVIRTDIAALMQLYTEEYSYSIKEGGALNTSIMNANFSILSIFYGADDSCGGKHHAVHLHLNAGTALKEAASKVRLNKIEGVSADPYIASLSDKLADPTDTIKNRISRRNTRQPP